MVEAFVLGSITPNKEAEVISNLKGMDGIEDAYFVYGKYDMVAKVVTKDLEDLKNTLLEKIRLLPDIENTQTLIVSKTDSGQTTLTNVEINQAE